MAKALLGHVGGTDLRMAAEVRRLRERVGSLESEVLRLRADNEALIARAHLRDELIRIADQEPALAGA